AQNSTTALLNFNPRANNGAGAWQVVERYAYGPDGRPYAFKPDGTSYPSGQDLSGNPAPLDANESRYSWDFLYQGQRYHSMYSTGESVEFQSLGTTASHQVSVGGGLYDGASGGQWYDPQHARLLQPVGVPAASNPYNPHVSLFGSEWLGSHADAIATTIRMGSWINP